MKRLRLFQEMGEEAVIATITQNLSLPETLEKHGLANKQVVNMYNYYQDLAPTLRKMTLQIFKVEHPDMTIKPVANTNDYYVYNEDGDYCMYVSCHLDDRVHYINYFNKDRKKVKRVIFDCYGNRYKEVILGEQRHVIIERLFNRDGRVCIELYYKRDEKEKNNVVSVHLNEAKGQFVFQSLDRFIAHWLDDLARQEECRFYIDRNLFYATPILMMRERVPIFSVLHSTHLKLNQSVDNGRFKSAYAGVLSNLEPYAGMIVSTAQQKQDLQLRVPKDFPIEVIPVGYMEKRTKVTMQQRTTNKIVVPARFSPEKRLEDIIEVIAIACQSISNIQLHFYGFHTSSENVVASLKNLIVEKKLENHVYFHSFTLSIMDELDDATAFILTSKEEGFCLTLLESLNCGVPAFGYDIRYGPSDLIIHGENGYLVSEGDVEALGSLLAQFLMNEQLKQLMSEQAYESANRFHKDRLKECWQHFFNKSNDTGS